jgi:hypothetical protein
MRQPRRTAVAGLIWVIAVRRPPAATDERDIIRAALRRPREWPAYVRLALQSRAAMRALARSAPRVRDAVAPIPAQSAPASRIVEPIALV